MRFLPRKALVPAVLLLEASSALTATLPPQTLAAFDKYVQLTERRIERELEKELPPRPVSGGQVPITRMQTLDENGKRIDVNDGMIHHWRGSILVPGATVDQVLRFAQNYNDHHKYFAEVEKSRLLSRNGDTFTLFYRLKRTKVITVVYNTNHTTVYRRHGPARASSRSATTRIVELEDPGEPSEREKPVGDDNGYLWRLNGYWRFEERDRGVLVECESVSLSRGIPFGLGWLIKRFVESVPRESLAATLTSLRDGVKKQ